MQKSQKRKKSMEGPKVQKRKEDVLRLQSSIGSGEKNHKKEGKGKEEKKQK